MMTSTHSKFECCMCGDVGLSDQLFRCKVCHFRSQHRYCSNLYPKAESYRVCNWCLIQKNNDDHQITLPSTTSFHNSSSSPETHSKSTTPRNVKLTLTGPNSKSPLKKGGSPSGRKRTTQAQAQEEERLIRRTKSEEITNNNKKRSGPPPAVIKHVFRNKVRRYKLLDQVSS